MDTTDQPKNRKERRAAARQNKSAGKDSASDIPMKQPDRSGPKAKTLFEIAEEKQALLNQGQPFNLPQEPDKTKDGDWEFNDEPLSPAGESVVLGFSLTILHLLLDVLVHNQYRQGVLWKPILGNALSVAPILVLLIYMLRTDLASKFPLIRQLLFFAGAVSAGCYLVWSGNTKGYYAVMKRAPPLGTLWIWSVIEMRLPFAAGSLLPVLAYAFWNGFHMF